MRKDPRRHVDVDVDMDDLFSLEQAATN